MACIIKRVLQVSTPMTRVDVHVYCEGDKEITDTCMYSWSTDSVCWVNWVDYKTYQTVAQNIDGDYYLRILLFGDFCALRLNGEFTNCYSISIYNENPFLVNFCGNENLFNPYANLDCALQLQQQLADTIICMLGIPCYYFQVSPDVSTVDYSFKEYVLHNVNAVKIVKLMIQDGQLPSSNPQMTEFDFEWDNDWEVELSKTEFARAFGDTAFPNQRDFLYVPMMKRMYEVNSAYDEKQEGLMWRPTTWKLGLIKWNEKTNVSQGNFEELIDNLTPNTYAEVFGKEYEEQERLSGVTQAESPTFAATNLYNLWYSDAVRSGITNGEENNIIKKQINNRSISITANMYSFVSPISEIQYQKGVCCEDGAFSLIVHTPKDLEKFPDRKSLLSIGDLELYYEKGKLELKGITPQLEKDSTYLVCVRWNRKNFTVEMDIYKHVKREDIPSYMDRPEMYYFEEYFSGTDSYDDRFNMKSKQPVRLSPYPLLTTNFKIYDSLMSKEDIFKESNKYTTTDPRCVINDLARPVMDGHGYPVK